MRDILDLDTFPLDQPDSPAYLALVSRCRADLAKDGMFNLAGLLRPQAAAQAVAEIAPVMQSASFTHKRAHNIYFRNDIAGLAPDHPALQLCETVNHTVCGDQMTDNIVMKVYEYQPLVRFLECAMDKQRLFLMEDPLARANVMSYRDGEALNWHFDRSEFTTTLLLQAPEAGGEFQYRSDLRTDDDPNYDGVARLLTGRDPDVRTVAAEAGTLNVFRGKNTAHRVTPPVGDLARVVTVFSYYETPGRFFSDAENLGFYGRTNSPS